MNINIKTLINKKKSEFDNFYKKLMLSSLSKSKLSSVMLYGSMNGGKRIRPFLVDIFSNIAGNKKNKTMRIAAVVENVHSYSLIHDDLPSMDNDDYRRGKPSVHRKFNEALAILAGDALHDLAYEILSNKKTHSDSKIRIKLIEKLSLILGHKGLAGGQSLDLIYENKNIEIKKILQMYNMKTSVLFSFCCFAPFIIAKKSEREIKFAEDFGKTYGVIFQIIDDFIDNSENFKKLGKTPGKDTKQGKSTLISQKNKKSVVNFCDLKIKKFTVKHKFYMNKWPILNKILEYNIERFKF